jgi:hypothetical protein
MKTSLSFSLGLATSLLLLGACADDGKNDEGAATETGDGDGDQPGDGDGDQPGDGDGDQPGDGDGDQPGDGDGDQPGDGDGDQTGDGDGDTDLCATTYDSCGALMSAFAAETAKVRSCSNDDQCGQELSGTSCGCTRNWVGLLDADTTCFYALIQQAGMLDCDLGLNSSCDCPEADGFVCQAGICAWNYI